MAFLKRYTANFTPDVITSKEIVEGGKTLVTEVEYTINAHETADSSNTLTVPKQYITFNYFDKDTNDVDFVHISNVTDSVVQGWITNHFSSKELELNALLSHLDGITWSTLDDIDLSNPYG
tara:strand:+ start:65 stop:427 length:363 start_codon:yes stop_codon:yes gene_type:complete